MERMKEVKTALITGGSRGIGKGIALVLASEGYDTAITYSSNKEMAEEVAHMIKTKYGRKCFIFKAQMEREKTPCTLVKAVIEKMGKIDVLVNNAGARYDAKIFDVDNEKMNYFINLDFKSYIMMMKEVSRHMINNKIKGNIINITSTRGRRAYPANSIYCAVKAALAIATESAALDLAPYGIRANCVAPGAIRNSDNEVSKRFYEGLAPRIPIGRVGTTEDIGNAVAWLVSDKAAYIIGATLTVDGGLILPGMPERVIGDNNTGWGIPK